MSLSCNSSPRILPPSSFCASTKCHAVVGTHVYEWLNDTLLPALSLLVIEYFYLSHDEQNRIPKDSIDYSWNAFVTQNNPILFTILKKTPLFQFAAWGVLPEDLTLRFLIRKTEEMPAGKESINLPQTKPYTVTVPQSLAARHKTTLQTFASDSSGKITTKGCFVFPFLAGKQDAKHFHRNHFGDEIDHFHPARFFPNVERSPEPYLAPLVIDAWTSKTLWCAFIFPPLGSFKLDARHVRKERSTELVIPLPPASNALRFGMGKWPPYPFTFAITKKKKNYTAVYKEQTKKGAAQAH